VLCAILKKYLDEDTTDGRSKKRAMLRRRLVS
jgi:hypothetical protein